MMLARSSGTAASAQGRVGVCASGLRAPLARTILPLSAPCAGPAAAAAAAGARSSRLHPSLAVVSRERRAITVRAAAVDTEKPTPVVKIDNHSDTFATIVTIEYGKRLGELLMTITALKNLDLNIRRAKIDKRENVNSYYITESSTSEKVMKSQRLEEIRMVVLNTLVATFPESEALLGGAASPSGAARILGERNVIPTTIEVSDAPNGAASVLKISTTDRPGLLVDIVRVLKDINLNVISAEVDTIGNQAQDEFFVTYHGEPLGGPMTLLVTNALQYYLSMGELATDESY